MSLITHDNFLFTEKRMMPVRILGIPQSWFDWQLVEASAAEIPLPKYGAVVMIPRRDAQNYECGTAQREIH
jgi:hypothetical protein